MGLIVYPAIMTEGEGASVTAIFPDLDTLRVDASSPAELLAECRFSLSGKLKALEKAGDAWPEPLSLAALREARPGEAISIVWVDVAVEDTPIR